MSPNELQNSSYRPPDRLPEPAPDGSDCLLGLLANPAEDAGLAGQGDAHAFKGDEQKNDPADEWRKFVH